MSDAERLEWVMLNVSGKEWRRLGVMYEAGCDREAIDFAMNREKRAAEIQRANDAAYHGDIDGDFNY